VHRNAVSALIRESSLKYYPYVGKVTEHPCVLQGTPEAIAADADEAVNAGADGVNLLAYRHRDADPQHVISEVVKRVGKRVIVAGSVTSTVQVIDLMAAGVGAFTIGGAFIDERFAKGEGYRAQVDVVLDALGRGE
jgi:2-keto-3-deoxy-6-phosphogluconate aldolase